jgi:hypothetical protein
LTVWAQTIPCEQLDGDTLPERALLAAVLLQAIVDAQRGDQEAARWLETTGQASADLFLGVHPEAFALWRAAAALRRRPGHVTRNGPAPATVTRRRERDRERSRARRAASKVR